MLCRDCLAEGLPEKPRCPACGSRRVRSHPEIATLSIAHIDCDAFYATVEKRDDPSLADKPVIVGGGERRGVVSACCYLARIKGVRSAMPTFKALELCPDAVLIPPNHTKYRQVSEQVRALMLETTPLVEPLALDEAFLDLTGTEALHGGSPARTLARLVQRIEREVGVTASVGLSFNKFLAKIASELDKPRGFACIGRAEALDFLADKPVGMLWGVGKATQERLRLDGIATIGDLRAWDERELMRRYGSLGRHLFRLARAEDSRTVDPDAPAKSISAETTFDADLSEPDALKAELWPLCQTVSRRLKTAGLAGRTVTLKLKTASFRLITRSASLPFPTQLAETLFRTGTALLEREAIGREAGGVAFRLIGIGASHLEGSGNADPPDLADPDSSKRKRVEAAMDAVRSKFGKTAIDKGRGLKPDRS